MRHGRCGTNFLSHSVRLIIYEFKALVNILSFMLVYSAALMKMTNVLYRAMRR